MARPFKEEGFTERNFKNYTDFVQKLKELQEREPQYISCEWLTDQAKNHKKWLYDPQLKRWFTPIEFYDLFNGYERNSKIFERVELKDPIEGIEAGLIQIRSLADRLETFSKKVIEFYKG